MVSHRPLSCILAVSLCLGGFAVAAPSKTVRTPANETAEEVLRTLVSSPLGRAAPGYRWTVSVRHDRHVNASSEGAGEIFVTSGLASILGDDRGLWAAALGHEIGHFVIAPLSQAYLPGFEARLEEAYLRARPRTEGGGRSGILQLTPAGGGAMNLKGAREKEYEADRVGVWLMADAGYHPDFAIAFDREMRFLLGDQPTYAEFLLSHPRWAAREQQTMAAYDAALAIFQSRWPDAAKSPGGNPPPIGSIDKLVASRDGESRSLVFHVAVNTRNTAGTRARVAVVFLEKGKRLQSTIPEYRPSDGSMVLNAPLPDSSDVSTELSLRLPAGALATENHKTQAMAILVAGDEILDISVVNIDVNFAER